MHYPARGNGQEVPVSILQPGDAVDHVEIEFTTIKCSDLYLFRLIDAEVIGIEHVVGEVWIKDIRISDNLQRCASDCSLNEVKSEGRKTTTYVCNQAGERRPEYIEFLA